MNSLAICTFLLICASATAVLASPVGISGNNVGNIVTVGVNLDADINTRVDTTIVNVLVALLTHLGDNVEQPEQIAAALQQLNAVDTPSQNHQASGLLGELLKNPAQLKELLASEQAGKLFDQLLKQ